MSHQGTGRKAIYLAHATSGARNRRRLADVSAERAPSTVLSEHLQNQAQQGQAACPLPCVTNNSSCMNENSSAVLQGQ